MALMVQPPARRDPGLPDIPRLVVLLRPKRRMPEIAEKEGHAAVYGMLDQRRCIGIAREEALGVMGVR
jgi:hypothetical protein